MQYFAIAWNTVVRRARDLPRPRYSPALTLRRVIPFTHGARMAVTVGRGRSSRRGEPPEMNREPCREERTPKAKPNFRTLQPPPAPPGEVGRAEVWFWRPSVDALEWWSAPQHIRTWHGHVQPAGSERRARGPAGRGALPPGDERRPCCAAPPSSPPSSGSRWPMLR